MGQQAVVGGAVVVEEIDIGLHVSSGKRLVIAVALVDAVQLGAHTIAVRLCGTAGERQHDGYDGQQMLHGAKIQNKSQNDKTKNPFFLFPLVMMRAGGIHHQRNEPG